eukprot:COSAG02_NODE_39122_length_420_cov_5.034268_1_plen_135_part_10
MIPGGEGVASQIASGMTSIAEMLAEAMPAEQQRQQHQEASDTNASGSTSEATDSLAALQPATDTSEDETSASECAEDSNESHDQVQQHSAAFNKGSTLTKYIVLASATVRAGPDAASEKVGEHSKGDIIEVVQES